MKDRVRRIFASLSPSADALVVGNAIDPHLDQTFFYLFDVPSGLFEGSFAIARPDGHLTVLSSPLEEESARQAAKHDPDVEVRVWTSREERVRQLAELVPAKGTVALNFRELTHEMYTQLAKEFPTTTWTDASTAIRKVRQVKDAAEVERLARAGAIGSTVARKIPGLLKRGVTESEVAAEIEYAMNRAGASGRSFGTIVGFGPMSAEPHYAPQDRRLEPGSSIVCDFGAFCQRYASDITRSFRFGPADPELKKVHATVLAAQEAALAVLKPGVPAKEVHLAAERVVDASPWKGRFTHGLGHSIGLSVHDGFAMNATIDDPIEVGMTITVEPGIYLPGRGGVRIEDDVVITPAGYRFLTTAPREYLEVSA